MPDDPVDPTERSAFRPLFQLLRAMDADIEQVYVAAGWPDFRPRYALPLIKLDVFGPQTIAALAGACQVSHSAMSQTVAALRRADLVRSRTGTDARSKRIALTAAGQRAASFARAEWTATEDAIAELEAGLSHPLSAAAAEVARALAETPFVDRITARLVVPPASR